MDGAGIEREGGQAIGGAVGRKSGIRECFYSKTRRRESRDVKAAASWRDIIDESMLEAAVVRPPKIPEWGGRLLSISSSPHPPRISDRPLSLCLSPEHILKQYISPEWFHLERSRPCCPIPLVIE